MAWDVEGTKRRIYEAALAEFAERGPDGTTVDRIAKRAKINRERVYNYYGDKASLFSTVIRGELEKLAAAAPLVITCPTDLGEWAGRTFDYQRAHPDLARLVLWEGLADTGSVSDEMTRTQLYAGKAKAVAQAQQAGLVDATIDPAHLIFLIIALSSYWSAAPQIARMLSGGDARDGAEAARRRAAVVHAAQRIAAPRTTT
ncbi:TetR/AcrR family transcriptional regulator [Nonomuraea sp. KC401]|uniref:TetR family transcriptional regulator n=1 Tax=unclassified Nonomuraea TaxID=2593643 RepID=UPI0010FE5922|nr:MULTISPECIES: TetR family transcriptional regulator [unclassified Nonomuraea]NBE96842.1 TetR family transcriptional regulator [Nonomuraea sp. K271]TLF66492.1 TetR/AcrR family transcriptional regulator [Nonomuraea sp. KC401]